MPPARRLVKAKCRPHGRHFYWGNQRSIIKQRDQLIGPCVSRTASDNVLVRSILAAGNSYGILPPIIRIRVAI